MNSSLFEISPVPLEKHFEQAAIRRLSLCSCANARDLISFEQASKLKVLPLRLVKAKSSEILLVAAESDSDPKLEQTLKFLTNKTIELTVIESNMVGGEEEVAVAFPGIGIKRLLVSMAGLKKL